MVRRITRPFALFFEEEASAGIFLLLATVAALLWANSPAGAGYDHFWHYELSWGSARPSLELLVNDGLMAVFFFVVGLEIKRELLVGELADRRRAALPVIAAAGGAIVPALIYFAWNRSGAARSGWGIPMATDIAFAVGILALLGKRVPVGAKVFLTALAIADDLIAVLVIALFYTRRLSLPDLAAVALCAALLFGLNALRIGSAWAYLAVGLALWFFTLRSGVHATIAGVLLAAAVPARGEEPLLPRLEACLHPWVSFGVMPLFALANAGLHLRGDIVPALRHSIVLGIWIGLVLGKPVGITGAAWIATKLRWAALPALVSWSDLHAVSWLGGIGFTMSLFIANLAFTHQPALEMAKLGVFGGSLCAGLAGSALLVWASRHRREVEVAVTSEMESNEIQAK